MKYFVGQSRNGSQVYAELINTPVGKQIARWPRLLFLAKEMLTAVALRGQALSIEHDMQRQIGYSFIIETTNKDTVFYGRLLQEDVYTRFVKNGEPLSTQHLAMSLVQHVDATYELVDISIGRLTPPRPGSANETPQSKVYWSNHALILEGQRLQPQTVTKICPY